MEFIQRIKSYWSSSAPEGQASSAQQQDDDESNTRIADMKAGTGARNDPMDLDVDKECEEQHDVTARRNSATGPVFTPWQSLTGNTRQWSGRERIGQDAAPAGTQEDIRSNVKPKSVWKPIPQSSFAHSSSPIIQSVPANVTMRASSDSEEDVPKAPTPRRRKASSSGKLRLAKGATADYASVRSKDKPSSSAEGQGSITKKKRLRRRSSTETRRISGVSDVLADETSSGQEPGHSSGTKNRDVSRPRIRRRQKRADNLVEDGTAQVGRTDPFTQREDHSYSLHSGAGHDEEELLEAANNNAMARILNSARSVEKPHVIPQNHSERPRNAIKTRILPPSSISKRHNSLIQPASVTPKPVRTPGQNKKPIISTPGTSNTILPPPKPTFSRTKSTETVPIASPAVLQKLSTMTPQVIITPKPRPSLLSILDSHDDPDASYSEESDDSDDSVLEVYEPAWRRALEASAKKRKASAPPVLDSASKRWKGIKQEREWAPLGDDIQRFGAPTTPRSNTKSVGGGSIRTTARILPESVVNEPSRSIPISTPGRILPPASLFRFATSQSRRASVLNTAPPSVSTTPITPVIPTQKGSSSGFTRILPPSKKSRTPSSSSSVRQTTLQSFIVRGEPVVNSGAKLARESLLSRPPTTLVQNQREERDIFVDDLPMLNNEDDDIYTCSPPPRAKPAHTIIDNLNNTPMVDRDNQSPPRSNIRRKRRLPSIDQQQALPMANHHASHQNLSNVPFTTPAEGPAGSPKHQGSQVANSSQPREDTTPRIRSLGTNEIQSIEQAVDNYRRERNLSENALIALVQRNPRDGDENVKEFWEAVYEQVADVSAIKVKNYCRRRYHNFIRGPWTKEQDQDLRDAYERFPKKWRIISEILNRSAEDVRCRWRDALSYGEDVKKDIWSLDEESQLRVIYADHLESIRAEQAQSSDPTLRNTPTEDLIDWTSISAAMGQTRTRLQCYHKWNKIQEREADENNHRLASLGDTKWRMKYATAEASAFSTEERLRVVRAIQACGASSEDKIPWKTLSKDLDMTGKKALAMKVLLRRLRMNIPGHREMDLQDTLSAIIEAYENAYPDDPVGFHETPSLAPSDSVARGKNTTRNLNGTSADKKILKKYSMSKPQTPSSRPSNRNVAEEDIPNEHSGSIRKRMRRSDQAVNKHIDSPPLSINAENLASELRMVWSQADTSTRAKQPLLPPRVSQSQWQRAQLEEEPVPSPPSVADDDFSGRDDAGESLRMDEEIKESMTDDKERSADEEERSDFGSFVEEEDLDVKHPSVNGIANLGSDDSDEEESSDSAQEEDDGDDFQSGNEQLDTLHQPQEDESDVESEPPEVPAVKAQSYDSTNHDSDSERSSSEDDTQNGHDRSDSLESHEKHFESSNAASATSHRNEQVVEVKVENTSDSEDMSNIQESQEVSESDNRPSHPLVDDEASEASSDSDEATESESGEGLSIDQSPDMSTTSSRSEDAGMEKVKELDYKQAVITTKYHSPSPESPSYTSAVASEEAEWNEAYLKADIKPILSSPSRSTSFREASFELEYTKVHVEQLITSDFKSHHLTNGSSAINAEISDEDVIQQTTPKVSTKSYGEGYLEDDNDHHITMKGWTPLPHAGTQSEESNLSQYSDSESDVITYTHQSMKNQVHSADIKYPILPQATDSEANDEEDMESGFSSLRHEEQEISNTLPPTESIAGGGWDYARWVQERDAGDDDSSDSDSDASSIPAIAVPKLPRFGREASIEL